MTSMPEPAVKRVRAALAEHAGPTYSFLVGEPCYGPPTPVREALARAAREADHRYGDPAGDPKLRELICARERHRGLEIVAEQVVIGNGSKGLLFGLLQVLAGDGLLLPLPTYPAVPAQARLLGLPVTAVPAEAPDFDPDPAMFPAGPARLYISSPSNPTGRIVETGTAARISKWCAEQGVRLIADEVYGDLVHDGEYTGFGALDPKLERIILIRSFSKVLGICGWRLGYVLADRETAAALARWQSLALNPPATPVQFALRESAGAWDGEIAAHRRHYRIAAERLRAVIAACGLRLTEPRGAFYLFFETPRERGSSADWCESLAQSAGIGLWPGEDFGVPGWARLAFGSIAPADLDRTVGDLERRLAQCAVLDNTAANRLQRT